LSIGPRLTSSYCDMRATLPARGYVVAATRLVRTTGRSISTAHAPGRNFSSLPAWACCASRVVQTILLKVRHIFLQTGRRCVRVDLCIVSAPASALFMPAVFFTAIPPPAATFDQPQQWQWPGSSTSLTRPAPSTSAHSSPPDTPLPACATYRDLPAALAPARRCTRRETARPRA
jgi:hypothetical protein